MSRPLASDTSVEIFFKRMEQTYLCAIKRAGSGNMTNERNRNGVNSWKSSKRN